VSDRLKKVQDKIADMVANLGDENSSKLFATIEHGKMLRSKLMLKICGSDEVIPLCAVIELIHLASLLHDDVIDNADLRRKKPTVNALYGDRSAVMFGDILYSKAFYELTFFDPFIARVVASAVNTLSIGELEDVAMSAIFNYDEAKYLSMLYKKTGVLIEASCIAAGFLAGLDHEKLGVFGKSLGVAFQIVDDILDITEDEATLGKPAFGDFAEGKSTLPYIYLSRALQGETRDKLLSLFGKKCSAEEIGWLKDKFAEFETITQVKATAMDITNEGLSAIKHIDNEVVSATLLEIAKLQISRKF
jgi:octaprenyl-diphosphate synthase